MRMWGFCAVLLSVFLLSAQGMADGDRPAESEKPYVMMQKLAPLVGTWSMSRARTMDGGATWETYPPQLMKVAYRQKAMMLEESVVNVTPDGFHMLIFISYDQYENVYRQAAVEDYWGLMDISEGMLVDDKLVMTNTEAKTYYPMENDRLRALKITMELTSPKRVVLLDESYDDGKTWAPSFRITYTKVPE